MLQLRNNSPYSATLLTFLDAKARNCVVLVVKATYTIRGSGEIALAEEQEPIRFVDEYHGEPGQSSVRLESDCSLFKPGTDVILAGSAHAPGGVPVTRLHTELRVGPLAKRLRVYGDRHWNYALGVASATEPVPFVSMPLVYERAFGGAQEKDFEPRNPVGTGFCTKKSALRGVRLPNIEDPEAPIRSWDDRPVPAGFGPLGRHWQPRLGYAGTYNEEWRRERKPLLPLDFDYRYFQSAHPGLIAVPYLRGGEPVLVTNTSPDGNLSFCLPEVSIGVGIHRRQQQRAAVANLDTVILRPDEHLLNLVWRLVIPCRRSYSEVREVVAFAVRPSTAERYVASEPEYAECL